MITLHFGRYNGRKDVVKKLEIMTALNELYVVSRTPFDPLNPAFTLTFSTPNEHAMYNYGWFEYHAKKYCGWLNWTAIQDSTYSVNMYIDPVVTAYENGCLNGVFAKTIYSAYGRDDIIDDRLAHTTKPAYFHKVFDTNGHILEGGPYYAVRMNGFAPLDGVGYRAGNNDRIYILTQVGIYDLFFKMVELPVAEQKLYWNSIKGLCRLPAFTRAYFDEQVKSGVVEKIDNIEAYALGNPLDFDLSADLFLKKFPAKFGGFEYKKPLTFTASCDVSDIIGVIDDCNLQNIITINLNHLAELSFTPLELSRGEINKIIINCVLDCYAEEYIFTLQIGAKKYPEKMATRAITEKMSFISQSTTDSIDAEYSAITSVGSAVAQIASGAKGGKLGLAMAVGDVAVNVLRGVDGSATPLITSTNIANVIKSGIFVYFLKYTERTDKTEYQKNYGKPDGYFRNISTLSSGFFQTDNVQLKVNNLPLAIIQQAETQINSGVWMTNPT